MYTNRSDVKCLCLTNAGDGEVECNFAIGVCEDATISEAYFNRGTGLNIKTKAGNQRFINKVQCCARVNQGLYRKEETDKRDRKINKFASESCKRGTDTSVTQASVLDGA